MEQDIPKKSLGGRNYKSRSRQRVDDLLTLISDTIDPDQMAGALTFSDIQVESKDIGTVDKLINNVQHETTDYVALVEDLKTKVTQTLSQGYEMNTFQGYLAETFAPSTDIARLHMIEDQFRNGHRHYLSKATLFHNAMKLVTNQIDAQNNSILLTRLTFIRAHIVNKIV